MSNSKLLSEIHIPNYPSKVMVSKSRQEKYYIKGKTKKPIPKKYDPKIHPEKYGFDNRNYLVDLETRERIVANPRSAGTPRYWVVNFQDIWNQSLVQAQRAYVINILKDELRPYIKTVVKVTKFPIRLELFLYDTEMKVDVDNKGVVYTKVITDLLVTEGKLPDDSSDFVNDTGRCKFIKVSDKKDVKMVVKIWTSD